MTSREWLVPFIFLSITNLVFLVKSDFPTPIFSFYNCLNTENYTSNSMYKTNLDTLLSSVSSNISTDGFYNASMGENLDRVNLIALCRADLQPYQCREYVSSATMEVLRMCPYQKQVVYWHEFCTVLLTSLSKC